MFYSFYIALVANAIVVVVVVAVVVVVVVVASLFNVALF